MAIGEKTNRESRSRSSLDEQLLRQLRYLRNSAALFDHGDEEEAIRLAVVLRVLFHDKDGEKTKIDYQCLVTLLGIKRKLAFVDTGLYRSRIAEATERYGREHGVKIASIQPGEAGLVVMGQNRLGEPMWGPPLGHARRHPIVGKVSEPPKSFEEWWRTPLAESSSLKLFSREHLVLIMANQDGGAHVSHNLDKDYADLWVDDLGRSFSTMEGDQTMNPDPSIWRPVGGNVAAASVRQIAYEAIETLSGYLNAGGRTLS